MKKFLLGAAAFVLLTGVAAAADLPVKAPYGATRSDFNWTGWYLGLHVGAGQQTTDGDVSDPVSSAALPLTNATGNGMLGGLQGGYNFQTGWMVWGIEGAFSWTGIRVDGVCLALVRCSVKDDWIASVSGRFGGLVTDRFLAYVKGGAAWKDTDYSFSGLTGATSPSDTRFGYLFGFGGEYKFTQTWSGFAEYNYMDFGRERYDVSGIVGTSATTDLKDTVHVLKAGVNYKF